MNGKSTVNARWIICSEQLGCYPPTLTSTRIHIKLSLNLKNVSIDSLQTIARTVAFNSMHNIWSSIDITWKLTLSAMVYELLIKRNIFSFYWWLII